MNPTNEQINNSIINLLTRIKNGAYIGNKDFQDTFFTAWSNELSPLGFIPIDKNPKKSNPKIVKVRQERIDDFIHRNIPIIIHEKNGSQRSPDVSIIYGDELGIECKTQKKGQIVWNGGLPEINVIYIVVKTSTNDVTFAMGQDMTSNAFRDRMRKKQQQQLQDIEEFNKKSIAISCPFEHYPRAMHNDKRYWFNDNLENTPIPNRVDREKSVIDFITTKKWIA